MFGARAVRWQYIDFLLGGLYKLNKNIHIVRTVDAAYTKQEPPRELVTLHGNCWIQFVSQSRFSGEGTPLEGPIVLGERSFMFGYFAAERDFVGPHIELDYFYDLIELIEVVYGREQVVGVLGPSMAIHLEFIDEFKVPAHPVPIRRRLEWPGSEERSPLQSV
ncbi:MAG: hypothetical protein NXI24_01710 [bacterium]|nr:hypothetical protein [bacterium]